MSDMYKRTFNELKTRQSALNREYEARREVVKQQYDMIRPRWASSPTWISKLDAFMKSHDVLYILNAGIATDPYQMGYHEMENAHTNRNGDIQGFITSQHVYLFYFSGIAPVYTFNRPLTIKHLSLIDTLFQRNKGSPFYAVGSIVHRMYGDPYRRSNMYFYEASRQFESVIRLIKGSYENGTWRQLDGFFGLYYNDDTNQLIDYAPPDRKSVV